MTPRGVDLFTRLSDALERATAEGTSTFPWLRDGLHLGPLGNALLAQLLLETLYSIDRLHPDRVPLYYPSHRDIFAVHPPPSSLPPGGEERPP